MADKDELYARESLEMTLLEMQARHQRMQASYFDEKKKKISAMKTIREIERTLPLTEAQIKELEQEIEEFKTKNKLNEV